MVDGAAAVVVVGSGWAVVVVLVAGADVVVVEVELVDVVDVEDVVVLVDVDEVEVVLEAVVDVVVVACAREAPALWLHAQRAMPTASTVSAACRLPIAASRTPQHAFLEP